MADRNFKGIKLSLQEDKVIKGIFSLLDKQNASEERPFILLDNFSQLYDEILDRKVTRKVGGHTVKAFSGGEIKHVNEALESLRTTEHQIIIRGRNGFNKKTNEPSYFMYMTKSPIITRIEYLKTDMTVEEVGGLTEATLKDTAHIKIFMLPKFLQGFKNYYKLLPLDISKEMREKCPGIQPNKWIARFINLLHRQDKKGLAGGYELRRTQDWLIEYLGLEAQRSKRGKQHIVNNFLIKCYDVARRLGYLRGYKTDQKGKDGLVDVFHLNVDMFEHLRLKEPEAVIEAQGVVEGVGDSQGERLLPETRKAGD
jgi:hypothetical protein